MKTIATSIVFLAISVWTYAQDYQITFSGTGSSSVVDSVVVENITQNKSITLKTDEVLRLMAEVPSNVHNEPFNDWVSVAPNPMDECSAIQMEIPAEGVVNLQIVDPAGRVLHQSSYHLYEGRHSFHLTGLDRGLYHLCVNLPGRQRNVKLISNRNSHSACRLQYAGQSESILKSAKTSGMVAWQFNEGDRLIYKGNAESGEYWIVDTPNGSRSIVFEFVSSKDPDGNRYPVVTIGTQKWMAKNLYTTKYSDGSSIPIVGDSLAWALLRDPGCCFYKNDASYNPVFGILYNWYALEWSNVCPNGWHVPAFNEWTTLETYLISHGYNYDNTTKDNKIANSMSSMKFWFWSEEAGTPGDGLIVGRNSTGFSAIPIATRTTTGGYGTVGNVACWWSMTPHETLAGFAWYRRINYNWPDFGQSYAYRFGGMPVRCIKD